MKSTTLILLFFVLSVCAIQAQEVKIDMDKFLNDSQKNEDSDGKMNLVWWIPVEFWKASFQSNNDISPEMAESFISMLESYTLFAIVEGEIGDFGKTSFKSYDTIRKGLVLLDTKLNQYLPLNDKEIGVEVQVILGTIKPMLKSMMGDMGENMHFFVFSDKDEKGERIFDPSEKGKIELDVCGKTFVWQTPFSSLLPPKICPKDKESMNGSWNYCPVHGDKLIESKK